MTTVPSRSEIVSPGATRRQSGFGWVRRRSRPRIARRTGPRPGRAVDEVAIGLRVSRDAALVGGANARDRLGLEPGEQLGDRLVRARDPGDRLGAGDDEDLVGVERSSWACHRPSAMYQRRTSPSSTGTNGTGLPGTVADLEEERASAGCSERGRRRTGGAANLGSAAAGRRGRRRPRPGPVSARPAGPRSAGPAPRRAVRQIGGPRRRRRSGGSARSRSARRTAPRSARRSSPRGRRSRASPCATAPPRSRRAGPPPPRRPPRPTRSRCRRATAAFSSRWMSASRPDRAEVTPPPDASARDPAAGPHAATSAGLT